MAETIMTFSLGFLIAALVALLLAAPMWRRAVQITTKRLMATSPTSAEDFKADKDRMRAEFAMSARKLEMSVESLRKKAETRLAELDKRKREVDGLRDEVQSKASLSSQQAEQIAILKSKLDLAEANLTRREDELIDMKTRLTEAQSVLTRQATAIKEANSLVEGHQQSEERLSTELKAKTAQADEQASEITEQAETIRDRDSQLATCGRSVAEQKMLVAQQKRTIVELTAKVEKLVTAGEIGEQTRAADAARIEELSSELTQTAAARRTAQAEIETLKAEVTRLNSEHSALLKQDQQETALMRERLGDLAVEVERTSGALEQLIDGEGDIAPDPEPAGETRSFLRWSPKSNQRRLTPVAKEVHPVRVPPADQIEAARHEPSSLADRIRSLQNDIRGS